MPVVCIEDRQRATANETLSDQLGLAVHHVVHTLPRDEPEPHTHYLRQPGDRFSAHIRRLAREIGRRRLGIALSAGGAKGLAHIGVIQVLEENGIDVDAVAGASMGACVGGLWACGLNGKELENVALRLERPFGLLNLIDFALLPRLGFMRGRKVESMLRDVIGDRHFSETVRQLRIVAMDLDTLERCVFDSGEIAPAIVTSMAMPGVVVPVKNDGHTFIDGGVADPLPTDVLIELGIDRIIGVNTIPTPADLRSCLLINKAQPPPRGRFRLPAALDRRLNYFSPGNILDVLVRSMHGAETRVAEVACKQADVVLRAISCDGKWHDFRNPRKYIQLGRQVAEQHLEELKALTKP
jgi:NTE family protein